VVAAANPFVEPKTNEQVPHLLEADVGVGSTEWDAVE